jgi:hypothetical protein
LNIVPTMPTFKSTPSADEIAERASRGEDISAYFNNKFTVVRPVRLVNVELTKGMSRALKDERANKPSRPEKSQQTKENLTG